MKQERQVPQAVVSRKREISLVWIVPFVALLVGGGLVYRAFQEKGPVAVISFESAQGIEAGKTRVKYKDVDVGKVREVRLTPRLNGVRVTVDLDREVNGYLTDQTRFWVVRPRLSGTTVSGLGTLLSGAYIAMDPGRTGAARTEFKGLELPPLVTMDADGRLFTLRAGALDSLDYGSPVYFRGVKVGQVTGYDLDGKGEGINIQVFIDAPYDKMVTADSKFWAASGIDLDLNANGLKVNTKSLVSILLGGIVLSNPDTTGAQGPVTDHTRFLLYASREAAFAQKFTGKTMYLLRFSQSVRGLDIGAPVEFKGFEIGQVAEKGIEFDRETGRVQVAVRIEVEQGRLGQIALSESAPSGKELLDVLVQQGMRGQLRSGNLLTGKLYLALDFFDDPAPAQILRRGSVVEIPTVPAALDVLTNNVSAVLAKLQQVPVETLSKEMVAAVQSVKSAGNAVKALANSRQISTAFASLDQSLKKAGILIESLSSQMPQVFDKTRQTLDGVGGVLARDADVVVELQRTLEDLSEAAKAVRGFAEELEQHPESLLRGKEKQ